MPVRSLAVSLLLFLASCGTGTTGTTTTTSEPIVGVGDVSLTRSGGIAGFVTMVTVSSEGVVTVVDDSQGRRESILPEAELESRYGEDVPVLAHGSRELCRHHLDSALVSDYLVQIG